MASVTRFEELEIWRLAREVANNVHVMVNIKPFKMDFALVDQIKRSSGSIMDNIAEGYERNGNKEFIQYLFIAKGSSGETRSQLYRAYDFKYITDKDFNDMINKLVQLSSKISSMITYLKHSNYSGPKYKST